MSFELIEPTKVTITNANPRRELHGEDKVRAIDIAFTLTGENTLLDLLEPGLREHHYCNKAATAGQAELPEVAIPLPNIRHPQLPLAYHYAKGQKWRGYRFIWDWGVEGDHVDFTDAVLCGLHYEIAEGGSVTIKGTIQYNGDELQDNDLFGELSGLAAEGEIYIKLLAPTISWISMVMTTMRSRPRKRSPTRWVTHERRAADHGSACHDNGRWSVADPRAMPAPADRLVCRIVAEDGTWHRPFTTLELAALQSLVDPEEQLELDGLSDQAWRERIGNAVPSSAAEAIAHVMGETLLLAWSGETFLLSAQPIWVKPMAVALTMPTSPC